MSIWEPFILSLIAGMATGIGGLIVYLLKKVSDRAVSFSLGFASGVMLMVAFNDLFLEAQKLLTHFELIIFFSAGALTMIALDLTIPHIELTRREDDQQIKMYRRGILIALGITLHNLPEGLVVMLGYTYSPSLGLIIAIAIMLHNIPEGVAAAIPLREAGIKPGRVAVLTLLSGLAEPAAALVGAVAISYFSISSNIIGYSLVFASGVMTYITADELIPIAHEYGFKHTVSVSLLLGIIFALLVDVLLSS